MPDSQYATYPLLFESLGISARYVTDATPKNHYLNMDSLEEIEENGLASRLGSTLVNKSGTVANPLPGIVNSLFKLASINGNAYRYAGAQGNLYRISTLNPGAYTQIASGMSGNPWIGQIYNPTLSALPYLFIADSEGMLKDNGALTAPQQMGIFQPQYPVQAQAQAPTLQILDNYQVVAGSYTYTGISGGTIATYVSTTLTSGAAPGIQTVTVAAPMQVGLFQLLTIDSGGGNQETVLVIQVTATGFVANFANTHVSGETVTSKSLSVTVPASTTASVSLSFGGTPITAWPTVLQQEDYIGLYLYVSDPSQIQKIILTFDCGNGTFQSDYFYRVVGQGPLQTLLDTNTDSSTSAADAVLSDTLGLFSAEDSGITQLNSGLAQWTPLLMQLSDFAGAGRADFNDPIFNWSNVNGYQITIVSNDNTSVTVKFAAMILFGGAGPDSFGGVAYDWLFTFYNANDGTESNPCMVMTNVNPPSQTNFITPRRQPVALTFTFPTLDPQVTHLRIYRRGGTLASNYYRVDQIPIAASPQTYIDILSDLQIEEGDTISFTNDVPVTSTLPVPVLSNLTAAINTFNQVVNVFPASMANISVGQQVDLADVTATNYETVIVLSISGMYFTAFVQNNHAIGETVAATAAYGVPVTIMAAAFDQFWYGGDPNNPAYLYFSGKSAPQAVGSASYVAVSVPSDAISAIVPSRGNLFVSTVNRWWSIAPGSNESASPSVYPTAADHGCVGPQAWCLKDGMVYYLALDGIRVFNGSEAPYVSQIIEFIWQGVGTTPIVQASPSAFSSAVATWWNKFVFFSYIGVDGNRHRIILDTENKRYRNDDFDAQSMYLEQDTNTLVVGDSQGLIHQDRVNVAYDEGVDGLNNVIQNPIPITLQSSYSDQGEPTIQKNYNEPTIDCNTNGQPIDITLLFNDGQSSLNLGTISTTERARVNLNINSGDGFQAYKCSLLITGSGTQRIFLYQAKIRAIPLAETRQSLDTYQLSFGTPESKMCKQSFWDYNASAPIVCSVYYDEVLGFTFTLPLYNGVRNSIRIRMPAIKFRHMRVIGDSAGNDFQVWNSSTFEIKPLCQGKGWEKMPFLNVEK